MSLINDALKRAAEAQGQAQAQPRPRGPKGVQDLPAPMTPVATRERPAWLPVAGVGLLLVALLGASGYFFTQWWKERTAWLYAKPSEEPATNLVAKAKSPPDTQPLPGAKKTGPVAPPVPKVAATNPPPVSSTDLPTIPPPAITPPPAPAATNPTVAALPPPVKPPEPVVPAPAVTPVPLTPTPVPSPVAKVETNTAPLVIPPPKTAPPPPEVVRKGDEHTTKAPGADFPELKLQGISRRKNKTFAVINGKTFSAGDRFEGVLLLKIDADSVTVERGGVRRELFLLR